MPHEGMRQMFHMMNEARVAVGQRRVRARPGRLQYALRYAQDRPQGRLPGDKNPLSPPVPIVEHADVRRMLLAQRAIAEGGLGLVLYCAKLVDESIAAAEPARREALACCSTC